MGPPLRCLVPAFGEPVNHEPFGLDCPLLADEFVRREALEGLQPSSEVVGGDEVGEMPFELVVAVVMIALDGCVLDRSVHSLDLTIRPRMVDLGEAMLDAVLPAAHGEHVGHVSSRRPISMAQRIAELDAVVGQNRVDVVGNGGDRGFDRRGGFFFRIGMEDGSV